MIALVTGAFAVDVTHTQVYLLFSLLVSVILASLLVSPSLRLSGAVAARARSSPRVRGRRGIVRRGVLRAPRPGRARAWLRVEGPFLPYFGRWLSRPAPMADVGFGASSSTTLKARFSERGDLTLGRFRVSALVPLGLASGPPLQSAPVRLRVVPRPANVLRLGIVARDPAPAGGSRARLEDRRVDGPARRAAVSKG